MKLGKKSFYFTSKALFVLSRKSNFRDLDVQIAWCHQMPKHKTRNTFYWITWEINTVCQWDLASLYHITKRKIFIQKVYKNCNLKTSVRSFCVCEKLSTTSIGKWSFWRKLLRYVSVELTTKGMATTKISLKNLMENHKNCLECEFKKFALK